MLLRYCNVRRDSPRTLSTNTDILLELFYLRHWSSCILFLHSVIPHPCYRTRCHIEERERETARTGMRTKIPPMTLSRTATVPLRHRWDGVLWPRHVPATMPLRYRMACLVGVLFLVLLLSSCLCCLLESAVRTLCSQDAQTVASTDADNHMHTQLQTLGWGKAWLVSHLGVEAEVRCHGYYGRSSSQYQAIAVKLSTTPQEAVIARQRTVHSMMCDTDPCHYAFPTHVRLHPRLLKPLFSPIRPSFTQGNAQWQS